MIAKAGEIAGHNYPYLWGGGHNSSFSAPYDCSGAVSAVLHAGGALKSPLVSGDLMHWGQPGKGKQVSISRARPTRSCSSRDGTSGPRGAILGVARTGSRSSRRTCRPQPTRRECGAAGSSATGRAAVSRRRRPAATRAGTPSIPTGTDPRAYPPTRSYGGRGSARSGARPTVSSSSRTRSRRPGRASSGPTTCGARRPGRTTPSCRAKAVHTRRGPTTNGRGCRIPQQVRLGGVIGYRKGGKAPAPGTQGAAARTNRGGPALAQLPAGGTWRRTLTRSGRGWATGGARRSRRMPSTPGRTPASTPIRGPVMSGRPATQSPKQVRLGGILGYAAGGIVKGLSFLRSPPLLRSPVSWLPGLVGALLGRDDRSTSARSWAPSPPSSTTSAPTRSRASKRSPWASRTLPQGPRPDPASPARHRPQPRGRRDRQPHRPLRRGSAERGRRHRPGERAQGRHGDALGRRPVELGGARPGSPARQADRRGPQRADRGPQPGARDREEVRRQGDDQGRHRQAEHRPREPRRRRSPGAHRLEGVGREGHAGRRRRVLAGRESRSGRAGDPLLFSSSSRAPTKPPVGGSRRRTTSAARSSRHSRSSSRRSRPTSQRPGPWGRCPGRTRTFWPSSRPRPRSFKRRSTRRTRSRTRRPPPQPP